MATTFLCFVGPKFADYADPITDNRQFCPKLFQDISNQYGPFDVDCCADPEGKNALCQAYYSVVDSVLNHDLAGSNVWMNAPFRKLEQFLWHYLLCKAKAPNYATKTSGCFVVPEALVPRLQYLLKDMEVIRYFPKGTRLFTEARGSERGYMRGVNQGIYVYRDPPASSDTGSPSKPLQFVDLSCSQPTTPQFVPLQQDAGMQVCVGSEMFTDENMLVSAKVHGVTCKVLIDTGAKANFISDKFVRRCNIPLQGSAGLAHGALRGSSSPCFNVIADLKLARSFAQKDVHFFSAPLSIPHVDAVLGLPWMREHNAVIDVANQVVRFGQHVCKARIPNLEVVDAPAFVKTLKQGTPCYAISVVLKESDATLDCPGGSTTVDAAHADVVAKILGDYEDIFLDDLPVGVPVRSVQHHIELIPGAKPFARSQYRLSPVELEEVRKQVEYLLSKGLIAPSTSPWSAPILFTPKPDGSLRMCIDYRGLNKVTVRDKYPLPRTDELLDKVSKAKYFTKLDLRSGYWQIPVSPESRPMTAFTTRYGLYEWNAMPFGLTNAPATFSRLMNNLLRPHLDDFVVVYLDDILIYSDSIEEHEQHVRVICEILKREGLSAKLSKCSFFKQQVEYLGHIVGSNQLKADPKKLGSVDVWPTPGNVGELRSFLGLCSYFRRYIKSFARIAEPLHALTGKALGGKWNKDPSIWSHRHQQAFEELKHALVNAPVLTAPDYSRRFLVYTDASVKATGAILAQEDSSGNIRPVCFYSRKLKEAEVNYPAHDLELLAIVEALREWRCYLEGSPFTAIVRTDHKPLQEFFSQKSLSRRQARWWEKIHAFDFDIKYVKGIENPADALSRNPVHDLESPTQIVAYLDIDTYCLMQIQAQLTIAALVPDDDFLSKIRVATAQDSWFSSHAAQRMKLANNDGIYYTRGGQIVLPADEGLRQDILSDAHDSKIAGHRGAHGTLKSVALSFWWPGMDEDVKLFVRSCLQCQRNKAGNKHNKPPSHPLPVPTAQFQSVSMDLITDLPMSRGYDAIFVVVDRLTKMVFAFPCTKEVTAIDLAKLLMEKIVLQGFGLPRNMVTDRDPRFMSQVWQQLLTLMGTKHKPSTAFHPQTDGQTERYNRVIEEVLRNYVDPSQDNWVDLLPYAVFTINNTVHSVTRHTPYFLHQGFHPRTPLNWHKPEPEVVPSLTQWFDVQRQCLEKARALLSAANGRMEKHEGPFQTFKVGDQVLLNSKNLKFKVGSKKLHPKFCGPFKVSRVIKDVAFELELPKEMGKVHPVFHGSLLKAFVPSDRHELPPAPILFDDDTYFLVDKVLKHRERGGKKTKNTNRRTRSGKPRFDFLVSWQGFGPEYNCWVKEENCTQVLIDEYWQTVGGRPQ